MDIKRKLSDCLRAWSNSSQRKPLVLFGARQVGKTYIVKQFAKDCFDSLAYLDFSRDSQASAIFKQSLDPQRVVSNLELYLRRDIDPSRTLIFFDEVQLCDRALTSLKYFCENAPEYHVIAAGSLLGVQINRKIASFPVGKVDMMRLYPLDFEEFLWALGEQRLASAIREAFDVKTQAFPLHERALEILHSYEIIGGMPEVVSTFVQSGATGNNSYDLAKTRQRDIRVAYAADMVKYAETTQAPRILAAWNSAPRQLAKENKKFRYKVIQSGGRANQFSSAIEWLVAAGVVLKCTKITEPIAPLKAFEDEASFKLYFGDVGLLASAFGAVLGDLDPLSNKASSFRGALAENYVYQQICSAGASAYYWGTASKAEIEFVGRDHDGLVIPIEVKSGKNVQSPSLKTFCQKYNLGCAVRISAKNFGFENGIQSVPLYAAWLVAETLM